MVRSAESEAGAALRTYRAVDLMERDTQGEAGHQQVPSSQPGIEVVLRSESGSSKSENRTQTSFSNRELEDVDLWELVKRPTMDALNKCEALRDRDRSDAEDSLGSLSAAGHGLTALFIDPDSRTAGKLFDYAELDGP